MRKSGTRDEHLEPRKCPAWSPGRKYCMANKGDFQGIFNFLKRKRKKRKPISRCIFFFLYLYENPPSAITPFSLHTHKTTLINHAFDKTCDTHFPAIYQISLSLVEQPQQGREKKENEVRKKKLILFCVVYLPVAAVP